MKYFQAKIEFEFLQDVSVMLIFFFPTLINITKGNRKEEARVKGKLGKQGKLLLK